MSILPESQKRRAGVHKTLSQTGTTGVENIRRCWQRISVHQNQFLWTVASGGI
jgi:hypothetical protein